jgi:hypothetical protein
MGNSSQSERRYFIQSVIWDKMHPVLTRKDRTGSRVKSVNLGWEGGSGDSKKMVD